MKSDLTTSTSITVDAPIDHVWHAITTPDLIEKWFFGVHTRSEWEPGSELIHTGAWQGRSYEDKGVILRIERPTLLEHTHWSPVSGRDDRPDHYETVTYRLGDHGATTELTVSEVNLPSEDAASMSTEAWQTALEALKELCESEST